MTKFRGDFIYRRKRKNLKELEPEYLRSNCVIHVFSIVRAVYICFEERNLVVILRMDALYI